MFHFLLLAWENSQSQVSSEDSKNLSGLSESSGGQFEKPAGFQNSGKKTGMIFFCGESWVLFCCCFRDSQKEC